MWECIAPTVYPLDWNTALGEVMQTQEEVEFLGQVAGSRERLRQALRQWKQLTLRERSPCATRQRHGAAHERSMAPTVDKPTPAAVDPALLKSVKETLWLTAGPVELRSALHQIEAYVPCLQRLMVVFQEQRTVDHFANNMRASESCQFVWKSGLAERRTVQKESLLRFELLFTLFYWSMAKIRLGHEMLEEFSVKSDGPTREAVENEAVRLFREAAGVLNYLSQKLCPGLLIDMDSAVYLCEIHPCVASAISKIVMGEAYLVTIARAESQQLSPATLVRLSLGATETFALARAQLQGLRDGPNQAAGGKKQLEFPPEPGYAAVAELGELLSRSRCFYYQALVHEANTSPRQTTGTRGMCIRLLEQALREVDRGRTRRLLRDGAFRFVVAPMSAASLHRWHDLLQSKLERCHRDNDLVYLEPVPDSVPIMAASEALYPFEPIEYSFTEPLAQYTYVNGHDAASAEPSASTNLSMNTSNRSIGGTFR
jgi:hypothetical protein